MILSISLGPVYFLYFILAAAIGAGVAFFIMRGFGSSAKTLDEMKDCDKKTVGLGIREYAADFAALYEPTYAVSARNFSKAQTEEKAQILQQWALTVAKGDYSDEFKTAYANLYGKTKNWKDKKTLQKSCEKLIKNVFLAGVVRSSDTETLADETTAEKFDTAGECSISTGEIYQVLAPYWSDSEQVYVKGVIR